MLTRADHLTLTVSQCRILCVSHFCCNLRHKFQTVLVQRVSHPVINVSIYTKQPIFVFNYCAAQYESKSCKLSLLKISSLLYQQLYFQQQRTGYLTLLLKKTWQWLLSSPFRFMFFKSSQCHLQQSQWGTCSSSRHHVRDLVFPQPAERPHPPHPNPSPREYLTGLSMDSAIIMGEATSSQQIKESLSIFRSSHCIWRGDDSGKNKMNLMLS